VATENRRVPLPAGMKRVYGELDRAQVVAGLHNLARRVGIQRVTMRELAAELGVAVPSVYYHVPGKQAALDLLADSLLASIPLPPAGPWDVRLIEFYCVSREVVRRFPVSQACCRRGSPGKRTTSRPVQPVASR
jgi:TetR/AcrR family transcriptional regulator, tetracycline repressor protein